MTTLQTVLVFSILILETLINGFTVFDVVAYSASECAKNNQFSCSIPSTPHCVDRSELENCGLIAGITTCEECRQLAAEVNPTLTWCSQSGTVLAEDENGNKVATNTTKIFDVCSTELTTCNTNNYCSAPVCGLSLTYWKTFYKTAPYPYNIAWPISEDTMLCDTTYLDLMLIEEEINETVRIIQTTIWAELNMAIGVSINSTFVDYMNTVKAIYAHDCGRTLTRNEIRNVRSLKSELRQDLKVSNCLVGEHAGQHNSTYVPYGRVH